MTNSNHEITIGIVDDDLLVVQLMTDFLNQSDGIHVSFTASGGNEMIELINNQKDLPEIILLDLRMKGGDGIAVLDELQNHPKTTKVIVLSSFYKPSFIGQMIKMNAAAFLPKEIDRDELLTVIRTVCKKGHYFSSEQIDVLRSQVSPRSPKIHISGSNPISEREREVLRLVCQQNTTQEIADKLFISPKTVESHKSNLIIKTGVKNTAGLVIYAVQHGIIDADEIIILDN